MIPGVILLFAGLILGGIWADQSWGRFWGWDPKETWGLITWAVFIVLIHGRWSGWLRDLRDRRRHDRSAAPRWS